MYEQRSRWGSKHYGLRRCDYSAVVERRKRRQQRLAEHDADEFVDASMIALPADTGAGARKRAALAAWLCYD